MIAKAAKTYVGINHTVLPENIGDTSTIDLETLIQEDLISPIIDPKNKQILCTGCVVITKIGENKYTYTANLACGNNYITEGYVLGPTNANAHLTTVPDGYIGISKIEELNNIRNNLSGSYILMKDLDFDNEDDYTTIANKTTFTSGAGWVPIGNTSTRFAGIFDGNNYVIKNLYINRPSTSNVGLFSFTTTNTIISKIGLENVNIIGGGTTGALVSYSYNSQISDSYSTGTVTGASTTGGLIGYIYDFSNVTRTYSTANVTGTDRVGGLAGHLYTGTYLNNSFATGNVTATLGAGSAGGLVGHMSVANSPSNCYKSDTAIITGASINIRGTAIPINYLKSELFLRYNLNWDIKNVWTTLGINFPTLGGTTSVIEGPQYNITKIEDLYSIRSDLTGTYNLMNDLNFENDSSYRNPINKLIMIENNGWVPIGNSTTRFAGILNGNSKKIINLYINRPSTSNIGLVGYTNTNTAISKIGLENVNIIGGEATGALVGYSYGSQISDSYSTGSVTGTSTTGGLIGYIYDFSNVTRTYSTANVTGTDRVGGLAGHLYSGTYLNNSFATGNVTATLGAGSAGGLVGYMTVTNSPSNCYKSDAASINGAIINTRGTATAITNLQNLSLTGLTTWDTTNVWQINSGAYPTLR